MNRFRDHTMRQQYDGAIRAYKVKHRDLFLPSGDRRRPGSYGSSFATYFWRGFDGTLAGRWDRASRTTLAYAYWRAGQDCAKEAS